jgi:hypothetical protein
MTACSLPREGTARVPGNPSMRRIMMLVGVSALIGIVTARPAEAQRPDFSGRWTEASALAAAQRAQQQDPRARFQRMRAPATPGSGWGKEFTITQTTDGLVVERVFFTRGDMQPALKYRYALDGSETRNSILMGRGNQEQVSTAAWDGNRLVIKTTYTSQYPVDGQTVECVVTQVLSLQTDESSPDSPPSLVMETTRSGVLGGPPSTTRTVYVRN